MVDKSIFSLYLGQNRRFIYFNIDKLSIYLVLFERFDLIVKI